MALAFPRTLSAALSRRTRPLLTDPVFLGVLLLALATRVGAALVLGNTVSGLSGAQDEVTYSTLGERLITGHGLTFPTGWYPWIQADAPQSYFSASMSILIGAIYWVFGYQPVVARVVMGLLSTAVVAMIGLIADRIFGRTVAIVSGLIAAVYAYLIFYGVTLVTETPFILSILIALYMTYQVADRPTPRRWVVFGIALALSVLFRMAVLAFVVPIVIWLASRQRHGWRFALMAFGIIAVAIAPFTIYNYILWHKFLLLESQFGHVLWNGNSPLHNGNFHPFKVFPIPPDVLASHNDVDITNRLLQLAIQNIINDPGMFLILTLGRLREYFVFWPTPGSDLAANVLRVGSWGIMLPFIIAGLVTSRPYWQKLTPVFVFMALHTFIYAISWTMPRYRVPVDAVLIPFGAFALVSLAAWGARRIPNLATRQHSYTSSAASPPLNHLSTPT